MCPARSLEKSVELMGRFHRAVAGSFIAFSPSMVDRCPLFCLKMCQLCASMYVQCVSSRYLRLG